MYKFKHKHGYCPQINIGDIAYYLVDENKGKDIHGNTTYEYKLCSRKIAGPQIYLPDHCAVMNYIFHEEYESHKLYSWQDKIKTGEEMAEWELLHNYRCMDNDVYITLPENLIEKKLSFSCWLLDKNQQRWLWRREIKNELHKENGIYKLVIKSQKHTIRKDYPLKTIFSARPYKEAEADAVEYLKKKYGYQEQLQIF